jgi:Ca2+-binding EF-hand superfamily protein
MADAAEKAFRKFDTNQDGVINVSELKQGLEKILKVRIA